jgi:hypothetical protein
MTKPDGAENVTSEKWRRLKLLRPAKQVPQFWIVLAIHAQN